MTSKLMSQVFFQIWFYLAYSWYPTKYIPLPKTFFLFFYQLPKSTLSASDQEVGLDVVNVDREQWNINMGVSKNSSTSKSSVLIGFSIINHPFGGTPIFGNTHIEYHPHKLFSTVAVDLNFETTRFPSELSCRCADDIVLNNKPTLPIMKSWNMGLWVKHLMSQVDSARNTR